MHKKHKKIILYTLSHTHMHQVELHQAKVITVIELV